MTRKKVSVDEVSLNVVGVSIKVLQLGNKQMTLSVFRQLPNDAMWDYPNGPRGEVWGQVNYFWNGCGCEWNSGSKPRGRLSPPAKFHRRSGTLLYDLYPEDPTVHIIWQFKNELRRSCLSRDLGEATYDYAWVRDFEDEDADGDKMLVKRAKKLKVDWEQFYDQRIRTAEQLFIAV